MSNNNANHGSNQNNNSEVLSPFHYGEQELQTRAGKREKMENFGRKTIRSFMPDQHREFYSQLPFLIMGSVDNNGWPWASIIPGKIGFIQSSTPTTLNIKAQAIKGDPLDESLKRTGAHLGLLGIELNTRRRNRVNGQVIESNKEGVTFEVGQSFGNCPQYIQNRSIDYIHEIGEVGANYEKHCFTNLDDASSSLIKNADTFFVSSFIPAKDRPEMEGVDVSHRGGRPGFVKIEGNTLTVPDYPGNNLFNTLGNFLVNPKGGLIFIDFITGDLLMLTGTVELLWDVNDDIAAFKGAERAWKFTLHHGIKLKDALPFIAILGEFSPNSLMTGNWEEASAIRLAQQKQNEWRSFTLFKIEDESNNIRSFYLKPSDTGALLPFEAGQYLTLKVTPADAKKSLIRTYTISSAPNEAYYRISVKKEDEGTVSQYLHNHLQQGDVIEIKAAKGNFYINPLEKRPAVLIAGGVGITPMMSMASHVYNEGLRMRQIRPLTIIHASRTADSRAFSAEFKKLEKISNSQIRYISFLSKPSGNEKAGIDFNGSGRIDAQTYKQILSLDDYDFFLCGSAGFIQSQYNALIELGVSDNKVFAEAFGLASLQRQQFIQSTEPQQSLEASESIIKFTKSKFEQSWSQGEKTLLEIAEGHGLTPEFSCRNGNCGACVTKITSGEVTYRAKPIANVKDNEVLICCAVPAKGCNIVELDL